MSIETGPLDIACSKVLRYEYLDSGSNSSVYKDGGRVVKIYNDDSLTEKQLRLYGEITNLAFEIAVKEKLQICFPYSKITLLLRVNPFTSMDKCADCGLMEGVTPFISGKDLGLCGDRFDSRELRIVLRKASYLLEDKLGVSGVEIIPINIKGLGKDALVVTDLCADIRNLRRKIL